MGTAWAGILIIGGGLLVIVVVVVLLLSAQRRRPAGGGWYAGKASARRPVPEEYYDPGADPDYRGDGLPDATDTTLRGDLGPPRHPDAPPRTPPGPGPS
jgi:hypothetical protein